MFDDNEFIKNNLIIELKYLSNFFYFQFTQIKLPSFRHYALVSVQLTLVGVNFC